MKVLYALPSTLTGTKNLAGSGFGPSDIHTRIFAACFKISVSTAKEV